MTIQLHHGDCLEVMKTLTPNSIDLVLTDPPYGTTDCKWDSVIPFDKMWECIELVLKKDCASVLFGSEPFSSCMRVSNIKNYKYDWIWDKGRGNNFLLARKQPLKRHEIISVFYSKKYFPIKTQGKPYSPKRVGKKGSENDLWYGVKNPLFRNGSCDGKRFPVSIQKFEIAYMVDGRFHPTQKPVALLEYLIKTYTNKGDTVLDFTMGSGSTAIACINTERNFIGIERDEKYFNVAKERIEKHQNIFDTPLE